LGGGLVRAEWFKRYRQSELPEPFDRIVQSWDTANKATELSDYSVCTSWGVKGKQLFLLSVFRRRLEYPALKRAVREQQSLFQASVVLIEDKASGTQLIQELILEGCHAVTGCEHSQGESLSSSMSDPHGRDGRLASICGLESHDLAEVIRRSGTSAPCSRAK
jgi:phage terminase large subunit-like protein